MLAALREVAFKSVNLHFFFLFTNKIQSSYLCFCVPILNSSTAVVDVPVQK